MLDRFTSSDVCLGGCCQGAFARNYGVFPRFVWRGRARTCVRGLVLKHLRKADVLLRVNFDMIKGIVDQSCSSELSLYIYIYIYIYILSELCIVGNKPLIGN